jgi:hypothetical protein
MAILHLKVTRVKSMDGTDRVQNVSTLTFDRGYNKGNIGNGLPV